VSNVIELRRSGNLLGFHYRAWVYKWKATRLYLFGQEAVPLQFADIHRIDKKSLIQ